MGRPPPPRLPPRQPPPATRRREAVVQETTEIVTVVRSVTQIPTIASLAAVGAKFGSLMGHSRIAILDGTDNAPLAAGLVALALPADTTLVVRFRWYWVHVVVGTAVDQACQSTDYAV